MAHNFNLQKSYSQYENINVVMRDFLMKKTDHKIEAGYISKSTLPQTWFYFDENNDIDDE